MGQRKTGLENTKTQGLERGKEGLEIGARLAGESDQISSLLREIDTDIDDDDRAAVDSAGSGYHRDYSTEFRNEAESKVTEGAEVLSETAAEADSEREKVDDAAGLFRSMEGVGEVGRGNAQAGYEQMRASSEQYENISAESRSAIEENQSSLDQLNEELNNAFSEY